MPSYRGPPPSGQLWHPAVVVHVQATSNCVPAFPRCAGLRLSVSHPRGRVRRSRPPRRWSGAAPPQEQVRAQLKQLGSGTYRAPMPAPPLDRRRQCSPGSPLFRVHLNRGERRPPSPAKMATTRAVAVGHRHLGRRQIHAGWDGLAGGITSVPAEGVVIHP